MQPSATRDVHILDTIPIIGPLELVNELPATSTVEHTVVSGRELGDKLQRADYWNCVKYMLTIAR